MENQNNFENFGSVKTKTEAVYDFMKQNILDGIFKAEEKIIVSDLSKKLKISMIPVREAVNKLAIEGFVNVVPHVGASVVKINQKEFEEITIIRGELESLAARLAVKYLKKEDFIKLEKIDKEGDTCLKNRNYQKLAELNRKFHFIIYNCLPYELLLKMISDLWDKSKMLPHVFTYSVERCILSQKEHKLIIKALKKGDGIMAGEITKKQKIDACNFLLKSKVIAQ